MFCGNCGSEANLNAVACLKCGAAPRMGRAFCQNCGQENKNPNAIICVGCGASLGAPSQTPGSNLIYPSNPPKDPVLMGLLSGCCIAGLGQMILGQVIKGVVMLVCGIVFGLITGGFGAPIVWVVAGVDSYMVANKLKAGRAVGQWEFF